MTAVKKLAEYRRPLSIHLAASRPARHCEDCGARHQGLCGALSDEDIDVLARAAQHVTIQPGTVFMEEGEPASYFYNINRGISRLFKSLPDGRRQITGFAGPGHFLGLAGSASNVISAETIETVQLCRFSKAGLGAIFHDFPMLEHKLLEMAMNELELGQQQMLLLGRKTAQERVASFLLAWAERQALCPAGGPAAPTSVLHLPMTRTDLADYLGLTIETVSRSLSVLKRDGLIELPNIHEIILLKPQKLLNIAEALA